jgi:hypothetical protein
VRQARRHRPAAPAFQPSATAHSSREKVAAVGKQGTEGHRGTRHRPNSHQATRKLHPGLDDLHAAALCDRPRGQPRALALACLTVITRPAQRPPPPASGGGGYLAADRPVNCPGYRYSPEPGAPDARMRVWNSARRRATYTSSGSAEPLFGPRSGLCRLRPDRGSQVPRRQPRRQPGRRPGHLPCRSRRGRLPRSPLVLVIGGAPPLPFSPGVRVVRQQPLIEGVASDAAVIQSTVISHRDGSLSFPASRSLGRAARSPRDGGALCTLACISG